MKLKNILLLFLLLGINYGWSQRNINDLFVTQGFNYYNPAYSPTNRDSNEYVSSFDTRTMLQIAPNNSKTVIPSLTYQSFTKVDRFVFLLGINHQSYSFTANNELGLGVAYVLPFSTFHKLSFGLRGDFGFYNLKGFNSIDYIQLEKKRKLTVLADIDFGIAYFIKGFELGISGKHLLASKFQPDDILLQNQRGLYTNLSYNFALGKNFELKPTLFLTPLHYTNLLFGLELGVFHTVYTQLAFKLNELRTQVNIEYRPKIRGNDFFFGLAYNFSQIYTDMNVGIRIGYLINN